MAKASEGLTRRINILADKALLAAFAEDTFDVGKRHVRIAINDSQFVRHRRWRLAEISLISGILLIVVAAAWTFIQRSNAFGEGWQKIFPGGSAREMAQSTAGGEPADPAAVATATPHEPVAGAEAPAHSAIAVGAGSSGTTTGPAAQAPAAADSAMVLTAVPVVQGGSRLLLSDTLSKPPQTKSPPAVAELAAPQPAAPEMASDDPQPLTARAAAEAEDTEVVALAERVGAEDSVPAGDPPQSATVLTRAAPGEDGGSLIEARLEATRSWLESANGGQFSIQLLLTDFARRANLETFLRERRDAGEMNDYYVFETRIRNTIWYGVLYKEYASFAAAKAALDELPEEFRYHQPFIRNVRDIATLG
jgi:septal ring-binding cell division protein DamX